MTGPGPMNGASRPTNPRLQPVKVYGAKPRAGPSDASPVLAGLIAGSLLAVLWTLLVYVTHNPVRLAAWGVGGLVGLAVARSAREPSASLGTIAAVLTVAAVILGKVFILGFALRPILRDEILRNREAITAMFMIDMATHGSFSPELQAALEKQMREGHITALSDLGPELNARMIVEAGARAASAAPAERERLVQVYTGRVFAHIGFLSVLGRLVGMWDVLWLGLGISSAWKLAQSRTG